MSIQGQALSKLAQLREEIERDAGPFEQLNVNALFLLNDVCGALGMTDAERKTVIGWRCYKVVEVWQQQEVALNEPATTTEPTEAEQAA